MPAYSAVVPRDPTGRIALQARDAHAPRNSGQVTTFGGGAEPDDRTPIDTARREILEELDLRLTPDQLELLATVDKHEADGQLTRCTFYLTEVPDTAQLHAYEGLGTVIGRPAALLRRHDLTPVCRGVVTVLAARAEAETHMPPLGRRWHHVQGVAAATIPLAPILGPAALTVTAAGWVHDLGYAPAVADTGLHALDGARYLARRRWASPLTAQLVAYHTGAEFEAERRGLAHLLTAIPRPDQALIDALTTADLTTSPDGTPVTVRQRLAEIRRRYPSTHPVHAAVTAAAPYLRRCAARVHHRLREINAAAGADQ